MFVLSSAGNLLEKDDAIGRNKSVVVVPVDFKLSGRVFVVRLVGAPPHRLHVIAERGYEIVPVGGKRVNGVRGSRVKG